MRRTVFVFSLALLALAPVAGCGKSALPTKPTDAEIKELRASVDGVQPGTLRSPGAGSPSLQLPGMAYRDWTVKETAVDALSRIGASAVPVLIEALSDPSPEVRVQAARSLARMGDLGKDAVPVLIERLRDPDEAVRQASARALGQMGPAAAEAAPALISIIKTPDSAARRKDAAEKNQRP